MKNIAYSIETERCIIRCYQPKDVELLMDAIQKSLPELKKWMPWAKLEPESLENKANRIRQFRGEFDMGKDYVYGVFNKAGTELIASTGLHTRQGDDIREIRYWVCTPHVGKGLATEITSALIKIAFDLDNIKHVEIRCNSRNERSARIPEKLGFVKREMLLNHMKDNDGFDRDTQVWVMTRVNYLENEIQNFNLTAYDFLHRKINLR